MRALPPRRPLRHRLLPVLLLTVAWLAGCAEKQTPIAPDAPPEQLAVANPGTTNQTTLGDAFSFLPPIAHSTFEGTFDDGAAPVVEICQLAAMDCGPVVATFTTTTGSGSTQLRVSDGQFIVNWHTGDFALDTAEHYRIRVLLLGFELGYVNVDLLGAGEDPAGAVPGYVAFHLGATLPIKFQVGVGALAGLFVRVTAGVGHSCALDVEGFAWCWGDDTFGQLGYGATATETCGANPCSTVAQAVAAPAGSVEPLRFVEISAGNGHTCALQASGAAWCWGMDADGQLGDGPGSPETCFGPYPCSTRPVQVVSPEGEMTPRSFAVIDAGRWFTCAVAEGGAGFCWGVNIDGQLGTNQTPGSASRPVAIHPPAGESEPILFRDIAAARLSACGVALDGGGWCWGRNTDGQLGNGGFSLPIDDTDIPVAVVPPAGEAVPVAFTDVEVWDPYTCARGDDGMAWCWGLDPDGPDACLNPCTTRPMEIPGGTDFAIVGPGCGLDSGGTAHCWTPAVGTTAPVVGHVFSHLDKRAHTCAAKPDGTAWCWGPNGAGQLGDGTTTDQATPVQVVVAF